MKFESWIKKTGPKNIARALNVDPSTVSNWRTKKSFPRPEKLKRIHQMTKGRVSYEEIVNHFIGA